MKFECPHCQQRLECEDDLIGSPTSCPTCAREIIVPRQASDVVPHIQPTSMHRTTKQCPYCAEAILSQAIVCRFCGSHLSHGNPSTRQPRNTRLRPTFYSFPTGQQLRIIATFVTIAAALTILQPQLSDSWTWKWDRYSQQLESFSAPDMSILPIHKGLADGTSPVLYRLCIACAALLLLHAGRWSARPAFSRITIGAATLIFLLSILDCNFTASWYVPNSAGPGWFTQPELTLTPIFSSDYRLRPNMIALICVLVTASLLLLYHFRQRNTRSDNSDTEQSPPPYSSPAAGSESGET